MSCSNRFSLMNKSRWLILVFVGVVATAMNYLQVSGEEKPDAKAVGWRSLFDGKTLKNWKSSPFGGEGEVTVKDGIIVMNQGSDMTGITWTGDELPKMNYEVSLKAKRIEGMDFFCGMTFQVNDDPCSLIIGGWGGSLVGVSSLDGLDAANNETARFETFARDEWYLIRLRVSEIGLQSWIDDKQVVSIPTKGRKISIRGEVDESRPFGIACYATTAGLKDIKIRKLAEEEAKDALTPTDDTRESTSKKK